MPISYIYNGEPMLGTAEDDFIIAFAGSTGTDNNTVNAGAGDDWVLGDSSDTWIPDASFHNDSIANAFNLEALSDTWTIDENPQFGDSDIPHTTVIAEATIGEAEYYGVAVGAGETITVDLDFGFGSPIGTSRDMYVELLDAGGNIIASSDDSLITQGGLGSFPNAEGSQASYDPFLSFTVGLAGTYYIRVRPFGGGPTATFTENNTFVLNVSVTGHAVGAASVMGTDTINGEAGDDALFGQGGADIINGGLGNDLIDGGSGVDTINGGAHNDTIYGGDGTDETVHGDDGDDILYSGGEGHYYGDAGDDTIYAGLSNGLDEALDGGTGIDTLDTTTFDGNYDVNLATGQTNYSYESFTNFENVITGNGNDLITGSSASNDIMTQGGVDTVNAGAGNDTVEGGEGGDILDGEDGIDTLSYRNSLTGVAISLSGNTASGGDATGDTFVNFESVIGSESDDSLTGNSGANVLTGNYGEDTLNGAGGNDTVDGGDSDDLLYGGSGDDTILGGDGNDYLQGGTGVDTMNGGGGNDTFVVDDAADVATESSSGGGFDIVRASVSYAITGYVDELVLIGTDDINGTGNGRDNIIFGNSGSNVLNGGNGADSMRGGLGDDVYIVNNSGDRAIETSAIGGEDRVNSTVSFLLGTNVERLVLTGSAATDGTGNASDNVMTGNNSDNTLIGRDGDDVLNGRGGVDRIYGGADNDVMFGGLGDDWVEGGAGRDRYYGEDGADYFVFRDGDYAGVTSSTADQIHDFSHAEGDRIRLNYTDANTNVVGDQAFAFIGSGAFSGTAGELRYEQISGNTYVQGDINGDGAADFWIRVDGLHVLVNSDFVL